MHLLTVSIKPTNTDEMNVIIPAIVGHNSYQWLARPTGASFGKV